MPYNRSLLTHVRTSASRRWHSALRCSNVFSYYKMCSLTIECVLLLCVWTRAYLSFEALALGIAFFQHLSHPHHISRHSYAYIDGIYSFMPCHIIYLYHIYWHILHHIFTIIKVYIHSCRVISYTYIIYIAIYYITYSSIIIIYFGIYYITYSSIIFMHVVSYHKVISSSYNIYIVMYCIIYSSGRQCGQRE